MILDNKKAVVFFGGGTGLSRILKSANKAKKEDQNFVSIVSTFDNGGSSGKLRDLYDIPAIGDIRKVLSSCVSDQIHNLLEYRFDSKSFEPHTIGNLILLSCIKQNMSIQDAIDNYREIFQIKQLVYASSEIPSDLTIESNEITISGEVNINNFVDENNKIIDIRLKKRDVPANKKALKSLSNSSMIIFSPGDFYTSLIASILPKGYIEKISNLRNNSIWFANCNLTQKTLFDQIKFFRNKMKGFLPKKIIHDSPRDLDIKFSKEFPEVKFVYKDLQSSEIGKHDLLKLEVFFRTIL
ncbi:MAG: hypothetical protein CL761_03670 [Chloroflexi bacterium]|nr:hypothetical protein [Chloroflexota bacterium]|tara:strand:- start:1733 stop:2623 length:891 start_codon:yes stop_codon:yes gene_type:complete